jgi:uncharacterized protein (DUF302 family)
MQADQRAGLELPMKVLVYTDDKGKTWLAYSKADSLKARFNVAGKDEVLAKMAGALDKLTSAAAGN